MVSVGNAAGAWRAAAEDGMWSRLTAPMSRSSAEGGGAAATAVSLSLGGLISQVCVDGH